MLDAHMPEQTPSVNLKKDPGVVAREKLSIRAAAVKKAQAIWRFFKLTFVLTLLGVSSVIGYNIYTMPSVRATDMRPCLFRDEAKGIELTGTRYYSYKQYSLFGIQFRYGDSVEEKTELDVKGAEMTVLGVGNGNWWYTYITQGEQGIQKLGDASLYQFVIGKKAVAVDAKTFCR